MIVQPPVIHEVLLLRHEVLLEFHLEDISRGIINVVFHWMLEYRYHVWHWGQDHGEDFFILLGVEKLAILVKDALDGFDLFGFTRDIWFDFLNRSVGASLSHKFVENLCELNFRALQWFLSGELLCYEILEEGLIE